MPHLKRQSIREDLLYFALPAIFIFSGGIVVSFGYGPDSFAIKMENLIRHPAGIYQFTFQNIIGLALMMIGFGIMIVAQVTLGRFYSSTLIIREHHQLITHGIYHFIRHPIYLGLILISTGIPIFSSSLPGLLIMFGLIPVVLMRIKLEERLLIEEFGDSYRAYILATRKLLPFIY
jgi:protein-S-isoprenylcysteine O-methyltransferase Ste14